MLVIMLPLAVVKLGGKGMARCMMPISYICTLSTFLQIYVDSLTLLVQEEKEVLALLSKLDLDNIHFIDSPPGMLL